mmetsp:Transcript_7744/g.12515  ORF Transcript_7744/g.12515 Transcript_7744/m.12515 type:complete len:249 (-) Transcript_7744:242-988(-)
MMMMRSWRKTQCTKRLKWKARTRNDLEQKNMRLRKKCTQSKLLTNSSPLTSDTQTTKFLRTRGSPLTGRRTNETLESRGERSLNKRSNNAKAKSWNNANVPMSILVNRLVSEQTLSRPDALVNKLLVEIHYNKLMTTHECLNTCTKRRKTYTPKRTRRRSLPCSERCTCNTTCTNPIHNIMLGTIFFYATFNTTKHNCHERKISTPTTRSTSCGQPTFTQLPFHRNLGWFRDTRNSNRRRNRVIPPKH